MLNGPFNLDHAVVTAAIRQWRRRLSACVQADGGHFEHHFSHPMSICRLVLQGSVATRVNDGRMLIIALLQIYC